MSIISKILVVLVVIATLGLSVALATYATMTGTYKQAAEEWRQHAEQASLAVLVNNADRFGDRPQTGMELAVREFEYKRMLAERDAAVKTAADEKAVRTLTESRITTLQDPLIQMQNKLTAYEDLIGKYQKQVDELRSELIATQVQLAAAEKLSAETEIARRFLEAKNIALITQARNLDQRIRDLEGAKANPKGGRQ